MLMAAGWRRRARRSARHLEVAGLAVLTYVPFLLSAPGQVSADTKQYLYLDPGRFLSRAVHLWDPQVGAGTVPHQHIGYLFPMGPWFWAFEQLGAPDWVAQRLWWGTISLVAALGARWLFRMLGVRGAGPLVGAVVYVLTPYQLAFTARISVLLLAWAALPWLVGLAIRAVRRGGWRDPALFALVALAAGGVNAPTLLLVGIGPALWLGLEALRGRRPARRVLSAMARMGVLTLGVSIWWMTGLRIQGTYGLPILQLTEEVRVVSESSAPDDLLRGLGNWFFYGRDGLGYSIDQAAGYADRASLDTVSSFAVPVLALAAAAALRWRHRTYFVLLVVAGVVVGAGAWPYEDPSPYGAIWRWFADTSSLGLALRNTARVVPVLVLGVAGLLAAAVGSIIRPRFHLLGAALVVAVVLAAFGPVWRTGYLSDGVRRPEEVPDHWKAAAAALDAAGSATRVLEIPGANFSAYRWGNTVEPITPGLIDRPYLAREVLPYGSPPSVNLLDALDRRMQQGSFEPASLAPVARMFGVGTVSLRSDLQHERFGTPRPRPLWAALTDPLAPGLLPPTAFGPPGLDTRPPQTYLDEQELRLPAGAPEPPPIALFDVEDPVPIVHTSSPDRPVVLAGDGDGIVDAAAAGLLDGEALLFELAALDADALGGSLDAGADLVLTDSHRRRPQNWFSSLRETMGPTERVDQTLSDPIGFDHRMEPLGGSPDDARTLVEHEGGRVDATGGGGTFRPEDRAVGAFDGDPRTSWRVGGPDPTGQRLTLELDAPVTADGVTLTQPQDGPRDRVLTAVRLRLDGDAPVTVPLGEASLDPGGQRVAFPERSVRRLDIELVETTVPPFDPARANAVGFAEVDLAGVEVVESVRLPIDLAERVGPEAEGHRLDVVMSRLRSDPAERGRRDHELSLERRFELPDDRSFGLAGTARVNPHAGDELLDTVLGTVADGATFTSSGHLLGDLGARASRAFDGSAGTAWTAPTGPQEEQWIQVGLSSPVTVDGLGLTVVADGRHSVPTRLRLEADGVPVTTLAVPEIVDGATEGATVHVPLAFEPVQAMELRLVVEEARRRAAVEGDPAPEATLPVSVAEIELAGVPTTRADAGVPGACRDDLLTIDGDAVGVRLAGSPSQARTGLAVEPCGGPLDLAAGSHRLRARPGIDTGIDIDRLVLSSDAAGRPAEVGTRGADRRASGATVRVADADATSFDLAVQTDGDPFWLVLGQSSNEGWEADVDGGALGERQLVNGYANGWLVTPRAAGTLHVELQWTPQRLVWVGLAVSLGVALACVAVVVATSRREEARPADSFEGVSAAPVLGPGWSYPVGTSPSLGVTAGLAVLASLVATAVSVPWIGLVTGLALALVARVPRARAAVTLPVPLLVVASVVWEEPRLTWLALALLSVDVVVWRIRSRSS